eukprot:scaffold1954_cov268-Pinguiococcus_pyrenoidosus.AAC.132
MADSKARPWTFVEAGDSFVDAVEELLSRLKTDAENAVRTKDVRDFADRLRKQMRYNAALLREMHSMQRQQQALVAEAAGRAAEARRARNEERAARKRLAVLEQRSARWEKEILGMSQKFDAEQKAREHAERLLLHRTDEAALQPGQLEQEMAKQRAVEDTLRSIHQDQCAALLSLRHAEKELALQVEAKSELAARCKDLEEENEALAESTASATEQVETLGRELLQKQRILDEKEELCASLRSAMQERQLQNQELEAALAELQCKFSDEHHEAQRLRRALSKREVSASKSCSKLETAEQADETKREDREAPPLNGSMIIAASVLRTEKQKSTAPPVPCILLHTGTVERELVESGTQELVPPNALLGPSSLAAEMEQLKLQGEISALLGILRSKDDQMLKNVQHAAKEVEALRMQYQKGMEAKAAEIQAIREECRLLQLETAALQGSNRQLLQDRLRVGRDSRAALMKLQKTLCLVTQEAKAMREEYGGVLASWERSKAVRSAEEGHFQRSMKAWTSDTARLLKALNEANGAHAKARANAGGLREQSTL